MTPDNPQYNERRLEPRKSLDKKTDRTIGQRATMVELTNGLMVRLHGDILDVDLPGVKVSRSLDDGVNVSVAVDWYGEKENRLQFLAYDMGMPDGEQRVAVRYDKDGVIAEVYVADHIPVVRDYSNIAGVSYEGAKAGPWMRERDGR